MKNGTSIALASEIELGEAKQLYRTQCLDALTKFKDKETRLKNSNKVKVEVIQIPYGYLTIYRLNKNKK